MTPIEQIKEALRFDDYVSRFVPLKRGYASCPFHQEKSGSLKCHEKFGKCFGCGWSGDVIKFATAYHSISTGDAIRMLADELGIQITKQPAQHPYDAKKAERIRFEAEEWRRLTRMQMIEDPNYETSIPFLEDLDSMTRQQILLAYQEQRTVEQAAILRQSAADHAKPTVESLLKEFLQWSR